MFVQSIDPRSGKLVAETKCSEEKDVGLALGRARKAQAEWALLERSERINVLREAEKIFHREKEHIADIIQSEGGFPRRDILGSYVGALRGVEHYAAQYLERKNKEFPLDQTLWPDTNAEIDLVPQGVIGHIGIWNYPFWQTMITAIPALMVGNAIVFKPSEYTTLTGLKIAELLHEAGVPKDVFIPLVGGVEIGRAMVKADFDALVFTGGLRTGLDIMRNTQVKPLILELSGNDPGIVCADTDIEQAARGVANGTFSHGGQVCIRIKRVYVVRSVADRFMERFLQVVDTIDVRERIGPLIREEARESVGKAVQAATSSGAVLLRGGENLPGPGFYYKPTVLLVDPADKVRFDSEIFGPVCPIMIVEDEDEAVRLANDSRYGLGATVWCSDTERAKDIASRLESGTVWINECGRTLTGGDYFNGWKSSGIASAQDRLGLFLKKKVIIHNRSCKPRDGWMK